MEVTNHERLRLNEIRNSESVSPKQLPHPWTPPLQKRTQKNLNDQLIQANRSKSKQINELTIFDSLSYRPNPYHHASNLIKVYFIFIHYFSSYKTINKFAILTEMTHSSIESLILLLFSLIYWLIAIFFSYWSPILSLIFNLLETLLKLGLSILELN